MQTNYPSNKDNLSQGLNVLDVFMYLLSKWPWFLLSLLIFGALAYLQYDRAPQVYFGNTTVIIKDPSSKATSSVGLDRYDAVINKVNVSNEILQFRSKALMQEVVRRLNADVCYTIKDGLRTKELYTKAPFHVSFIDAAPESVFSMEVTLKDATSVVVDLGHGKAVQQNLGDTLNTTRGRILITPTNYCNSAWFNIPISVRKVPLMAKAESYLSQFGIRQVEEESSILTLSLKDSSPEKAEDMLNALVNVYNEDAINEKNQIAVNTANFINERLIIIEKELGGVESSLEEFKKQNKIVDIGSTAGRYLGESQKYNEESAKLEAQLQFAQYIKDYMTDPSKDTELIPANTGISDVNLETQIGQYNAIRLRRDKLVNDGSDKNPVVEELNNSLRSMKQSIIRSVDNVIVNINARLNDAQNYELRAQARVTSIPTKERQMLSIERQQKIKENLYMFLLNRREENALSQAMADNNARVIDVAESAAIPISPSRNRLMVLGILLGLAFPLIIFLMILFLDTRVHGRKDVTDNVNVPFLCEIPQDKSASRQTGARESSRAVAEAMRILRTNMLFMGKKDSKLQVITFTSFNEGAGKTFIAWNLAQSFVYARKRVALLDLDIRKGTLSRFLKKHHHGVTNFLADDSVLLDDIIQKGEEGKTPDIITAGSTAPNPAELLMDARLDELISALKERYDYIIADNVPVGIIADATIANRVADLTIFVVRAGKFDRRQLPDVQSLYDEHKLNNMALVLNGTDLKRWGYGYGHYGYGYGYGHYGYGYGSSEKSK